MLLKRSKLKNIIIANVANSLNDENAKIPGFDTSAGSSFSVWSLQGNTQLKKVIPRMIRTNPKPYPIVLKKNNKKLNINYLSMTPFHWLGHRFSARYPLFVAYLVLEVLRDSLQVQKVQKLVKIRLETLES